MKINSVVLVSLGLFMGCAMPSTVVKATDTRPRIAITGAPTDSLLYVDGINMGAASQYDGKPNVLILQSGTHKVQILSNGQSVYDRSIFIESELKNIVVK